MRPLLIFTIYILHDGKHVFEITFNLLLESGGFNQCLEVERSVRRKTEVPMDRFKSIPKVWRQ